MFTDKIMRIDTGRACGGIVFHNGVVVQAAPYFRALFMGKTVSHAKLLVEFKGWRWEWVNKMPVPSGESTGL